MAFFDCSFHSDALGKACTMKVILPQRAATQIGMESVAGRELYPVLYLLHGLSDDHTIWSRRTSIERYAAAYPLAVVMPDGDRSFYMDMAHGGRYDAFLTQELPSLVCDFFPISRRREDTFIAGLSMGGFGALKSALKYPERYAAGAGISSVLGIDFLYRNSLVTDHREFDDVFGSEERWRESDDNPYRRAEQLAAMDGPRPKLLQICGTEDFLYADNLRFRDHLRRLGAFDYEYFEGPGVHCWEFWDQEIQRVLRWLPLAGKRP